MPLQIALAGAAAAALVALCLSAWVPDLFAWLRSRRPEGEDPMQRAFGDVRAPTQADGQQHGGMSK